ncbi:hypothetical protein CLIB1423_14S00342 [[Candida] railenensis]|uniref:Uncharacterized protein n=1 Tax=[Candida] railenensis TaxID=45579 RepID=A0A9P0QSB5_9ASCO|nr:hypothetical protein CLIB1423_14S00342 [[Candida] railenensis]
MYRPNRDVASKIKLYILLLFITKLQKKIVISVSSLVKIWRNSISRIIYSLSGLHDSVEFRLVFAISKKMWGSHYRVQSRSKSQSVLKCTIITNSSKNIWKDFLYTVKALSKSLICN